MMHKRTYSTDEVESIVSLATRLQAEHQEQATLEEIEQAAAEFGVDPKFVHLAAQKLDEASIPPLPVKREVNNVPFKALLILYVLTLVPTIALIVGVNVVGMGFWPCWAAILLFGVGLTFPVRDLTRLAIVVFGTTVPVAFIVAFLVKIDVMNRVYFHPWSMELAVALLVQLAVISLGYGVARLVEYVFGNGKAPRSMTQGRSHS